MTLFSVLLLDTETQTQNHYLVLALADALRKHAAVSAVVVADHADALRRLTEQQIDVFFAFGGARSHAPLLSRLASLARCSVLWITEDPYERDANVRYSAPFDIVFTNDLMSVDAYGGRAHHLPLAASTLFQDLPVREDDREYLYDLLFIGTAWPNRVRSLNTIVASLPSQAKIKLALPWNQYIGKPELNDGQQLTDWRCGNRDFARMVNRSRIVLTLPREFSGSNPNLALGSTPPPRLFEAALAGGFQVVVGPHPEIQAYYDAGSEIQVCADDREAIAAITEQLERPRARIDAAKAARERTLREHLFAHRVETIVERISQKRWRNRESADAQRAARKTILFLTHNRVGQRNFGGIEIYQEALASHCADFDFLFLFPVIEGERWSLRLQGEGVDLRFEAGATGLPELTNRHVEHLFQQILFERRIDLVHIHHLLHLPLSLPLIAKACGVPLVLTLHDHFLICERWLLLDRNGHFCDVVHRGSDQCDACLVATQHYPPGSKARRDNFMSLVVRAVDAFITSTPATGAYVNLFYPEIDSRRIVEIEMSLPGLSAPTTKTDGARAPRGGASKPALVVAVVGNFAAHKGADDLVELMRLCEGYDIRFEVFGRVDEPYLGRLRGLPAGRVTIHGSYQQATIVPLLHGCDVSLHLSIWPETFVLSLTEAWQAGLVPIVTSLGALGERVTDGFDGFIVRPHHPGGVMRRLLDLYFDQSRLSAMRKVIAQKRFPPAGEHVERLQELYHDLIEARPCPHDRVPDRARGSFDLALSDLGVRVNDASWASSAIGWDHEPETGAAAPSRAIPSLSVAPDLEPAHRGLKRETILLTEPQTAWALDIVQIDQKEIALRTGCEAATRSLAVRGWLRHANWHEPKQTYLRFVGTTRTYSAKLSVETRPDLAQAFEDEAAGRAGFSGRIAVQELDPGFYRVDLLQVASGRLLVAEGVLRFFAAPRERFGSPASWRRHTAPAAEVQSRLTVSHLQQNLPDLGGLLLASRADDWALAAVVAGAQVPSDFRAVLRPEAEGPTYAVPARALPATAAPDQPGNINVSFVASLAGIQAGVYKLGLFSAAGPEEADTSLRIEIVDGPDRSRIVDRSPSWLRRVTRRRWLYRRPIIEHLEPIQAPSADPADIVLRCRGWSFVRNLGEPICTVAQWQDGGRPRFCISAPLARPEIAARLDQPDAASCGYVFTLPAQSLRAGRVRFFQCFQRRTVEFLGFDREVRRICPPELLAR